MTTARELLQQARDTLLQARLSHRDSLLLVGSLLHDYLLAYLREGQGLGENVLIRRELTRQHAVIAAARELNLRVERVCIVVATSQVVALLSDGGNVGQVSYHVLEQFYRFIRRKSTRADTFPRTPEGRRAMDILARETWVIKPEFAATAPALFQQAIMEGWSGPRAERDTLAHYVSVRGPNPKRAKKSKVHRQASIHIDPEPTIATRKLDTHASLENVKGMAKFASPGDVAEICLALIEASEDPAAVAVRLRVLLARFLPRKEREKLALYT